MAAGHRWREGGDELLKYLAAAYQENGQIHWPTLLAATAGIAGEMALLAKEVNLPERGYVLGRNVSTFLCDDARSPKSLWGYCLLVGEEAFGLKKSSLPDFRETETRIMASLAANADFVPLSVPAHLAPRHNVLNAGPRHRRQIWAIAQTNQLDNADAAFALMTAAMKVLGFTRHIGAAGMMTLAMESMIGCARVVPLEEPLSNPSFGPIADILPQGAKAPAAPPPPVAPPDLWGGEKPELEPVPAELAEASSRKPRKAAGSGGFGRRN